MIIDDGAAPYLVRLAPPARRAIERGLPETVAAAAIELIYGDLSLNPHRVGKPLGEPYEGHHSARCGRDYRVVYVIDDANKRIEVKFIRHRGNAYRT